jgi:cytochrome c peroxidase
MIFSPLNKFIFTILLIGISILACKKNEQMQATKEHPTPYELTIPNGFPKIILSKENPLTYEGIALGKQLYSDPILSTNGRSCMSCHLPNYSFSIPVFMASNGFKISVPPHINLAFKKHFNWIGNLSNLDTLAMGDFEPEFFNTDHTLLVQKLLEHPSYCKQIEEAFGVKEVTQLSFYELKILISKALSQYLKSRISANSKFDKFRRKEALLSPDEMAGYFLFYSEKADCFHCHSEPLFTDNELHNNGINSSYIDFNLGNELFTNKASDRGKFVTPTLRNIMLTAPYMHDGRYGSLEQVIEFYDHGVNQNEWVDPLMTKTNGSKELNLNPLEKMQLIAFLNTLTDSAYLIYP